VHAWLRIVVYSKVSGFANTDLDRVCVVANKAVATSVRLQVGLEQQRNQRCGMWDIWGECLHEGVTWRFSYDRTRLRKGRKGTETTRPRSAAK
jgi:hypothetical protein